jgi:hypothetical protein
MNISKIAEKINSLAINYKMGDFQDIRKELKGLTKKQTSKIFSTRTIFDAYAFHDGGRTEIQFNIGIDEENNALRYGLAFSLEPNQTLPDVKILDPQIGRLNNLVRSKPSLFLGYKMWCHTPINKTDPIPMCEIPSSFSRPHNFIFFGKLMSSKDINYDEILTTFDKMLPIYEYVLTVNKNIQKYSPKINNFKYLKTNVKLPTSRTYTSTQIAIDIDIRHSKIQEIIVNKLEKTYGNENVSQEHPIFGNHKIDIVVNDNGKHYFYEIKTASTPRECIRQALGQILDYCYWPGQKNADKLFIVGEQNIDIETQSYLNYINKNLNISLEYISIKV